MQIFEGGRMAWQCMWFRIEFYLHIMPLAAIFARNNTALACLFMLHALTDAWINRIGSLDVFVAHVFDPFSAANHHSLTFFRETIVGISSAQRQFGFCVIHRAKQTAAAVATHIVP